MTPGLPNFTNTPGHYDNKKINPIHTRLPEAHSGRGYDDEFKDASIAYLLGRSYVGMRAEDVLVCARYAMDRSGDGESKVQLVAVGSCWPSTRSSEFDT